MCLRQCTAPPKPYTAKNTDPRLILRHAVSHVKPGNRIATFKLLEFYNPKLTTYPAIQSLQFIIASNMAIVIYPARQGKVQTHDNLPIAARLVTPGQLTYRVLKSGDTLQGQSKAPVAETGDSQESSVRLHGLPPISPHSLSI